MADSPNPPPDDDLDRRLATLALLPVADRPILDDPLVAFAPTSRDDSAEPFAVDRTAREGIGRRSHGLWLVAAAAALVLLVAGVVAFGRDRGGDLAASGALSDAALTDALGGHEYRSVSVTESGVPRTIVGQSGTSAPGHVTLTFRQSTATDTVSAVAACNRSGFAYRIEDGHLIAADGMMSHTQGYCDGPHQEQDAWLTAIVSSSPALALDGDRLTVTSGDTVIELVDAAVADPDRPLVGTHWNLETIIDGGEATSAAGLGAFLDVVDDGTSLMMKGNTGCTPWSGSVTVVDDRLLTMEPLGDTATCPDGTSDRVPYGAVLRSGARFEVVGSQLTITNGDRALVFRAAPGEPPVTDPPTPDPAADVPLVGTTWTLETIVSGDTATSVQARIGDEPTLVVSPSAVPPHGLEVVVNDGCGTGRGPVTVTDTTITSESMNFDVVTCADSEDFGPAMQPVLTGEATYEIDGSQLTLTGDGDRRLVFRAAPTF